MSSKVEIHTIDLPSAYAPWFKIATGNITKAMSSKPSIIVFKNFEDQKGFHAYLMTGKEKPRFQKKNLKDGSYAFCSAEFPEAVAALEKMPGVACHQQGRNLLEDLLQLGQVRITEVNQVDRLTKAYYRSSYFSKNNKVLSILKDGDEFIAKVV